MLLRVLRTHLRPYAGNLSLVVVLQLIGTIASLYLPSLNADIIDNGVAKGDTGYIMSTGGWMLGVSLLQIACTITAVYFGAKTAALFGRDPSAQIREDLRRFKRLMETGDIPTTEGQPHGTATP